MTVFALVCGVLAVILSGIAITAAIRDRRRR
jgi:hypothetical protein